MQTFSPSHFQEPHAFILIQFLLKKPSIFSTKMYQILKGSVFMKYFCLQKLNLMAANPKSEKKIMTKMHLPMSYLRSIAAPARLIFNRAVPATTTNSLKDPVLGGNQTNIKHLISVSSNALLQFLFCWRFLVQAI